METLDQYNERMLEVVKKRVEASKHTGLSCPKCNTELLYVNPAMSRGIGPPGQVVLYKAVECPSCGYHGEKIS